MRRGSRTKGSSAGGAGRKDLQAAVFASALGWAGVAVSEKGICRVVLPGKGKASVQKELQGEGSPARAAGKAVRLLQKYFSGSPVSFDLPLDMSYYTDFQRAVWTAAARIPYGETRSYGWIARQIGKPQAARAVGQAMGANPVPILVP